MSARPEIFRLKKYYYLKKKGLLVLASLRINSILSENESDNNKEKRGPAPTSIEWLIFCYVASE